LSETALDAALPLDCNDDTVDMTILASDPAYNNPQIPTRPII
jgi:hypothetical protein